MSLSRNNARPLVRAITRNLVGTQEDGDPILALFANGEQGAYYITDDADNPISLLPSSAGTFADITQATAALRPAVVSLDGVPSIKPDFVDDSLTVPNTLATGDLLIETPYGWMLSQDQHFNSANFNLPMVWNSKTLVHQGLTPAQVASLGDSLRGDRQWGLFLSPDTVFNGLQFNGDGTAKTVRFVGANGATFDQVFTNAPVTPIDVAPEGLTAPVLMMLPIVLGESGSGNVIVLNNNNLTGSIPDWSGWTHGANMQMQFNNLTGSIPDWSGWTSGAGIFLHLNNLTGSIPDWSTWTSGNTIFLYDNNLTDVMGTSIPATVIDLQLNNNALTQTAVDRVLTSLDAAGGTGGSVRLEGGTNAVPSATGLAAKTNLEGKGWTVTVNV